MAHDIAEAAPRLQIEVGDRNAIEVNQALTNFNKLLFARTVAVRDTMAALYIGEEVPAANRDIVAATESVLQVTGHGSRLGFGPNAELMWQNVWNNPLHREAHRELRDRQGWIATSDELAQLSERGIDTSEMSKVSRRIVTIEVNIPDNSALDSRDASTVKSIQEVIVEPYDEGAYIAARHDVGYAALHQIALEYMDYASIIEEEEVAQAENHLVRA